MARKIYLSQPEEKKTMLEIIKKFYRNIRDFLLLILAIILIYQNFSAIKNIPKKVTNYFAKNKKEE